MILFVGFFILSFYHYALDNNRISKKTKKKVSHYFFDISLFVIIIICFFVALCSYKKCIVKFFYNYEILNKRKNESFQNPFIPLTTNFIQFTNTRLLNLSLSNQNKNLLIFL